MKNTKIIILCGGKGKRLRPLTNNTPKPLIRVNNKEILKYIIENLIKQNYKNITLATGYKSDKFKSFLIKNKFNANISIINSGDTDIINRIKACIKGYLNDFIVLYGDTISNVKISELIKYSYKSKKNKITITAWSPATKFGILEFDKMNNLIKFNEKPNYFYWINIGYIHFKSINHINIAKFKYWENFLYSLTKNNNIKVYKHYGKHITINSIDELNTSKREIKKL